MSSPAESKVASLISKSLSDAQRTNAAHQRAAKALLQAHDLEPKYFLSCFTHALNRILIIYTRPPPIERLISFIASFVATTSVLTTPILAYLLSHTNAHSRAVRFRTTQLVANVLHLLPEDAALADALWGPLEGALLARAKDRIPRVRSAAAAGLCRLQGDADEEDPFCAALETLLCDSSAAVRKAALNAIAISDYTLPLVAGKTRDVSPDVRKMAYSVIARKINAHDLLHEERVELLTRGLRDRIETVQESCKQALLLDGWFDGACEGNVFQLVDLLGCNEREDDVLRALRVIFQSERCASLVQAVEIDVNNMTHADILVLRGLSDVKSNALEKYLPTTSLYADVLRYYAVDDFAARHLLELCAGIDMSDEAGRRAVEDVVRVDFLASEQISEATAGSAVRAMRRVMLDEEAMQRLLLEVVRNDILKTEESHVSEDDSKDVETKGGNKAWSCIRALNVCREVLRLAKQDSSASVSNTLCMNMLELAVVPNLIAEDESVRKTAMECLGLFSLLDRSGDEARGKMPLFMTACKTDVLEIQEVALQIIVDLLMVFDFTESEPSTVSADIADDTSQESGEEDSKTDDSPSESDSSQDNTITRKGSFSSLAEECINMLSQNITHSDGTMRTLAVQGLARLLFVRRIAPTSTLLSRLLIVHHNPTTEDDDTLRQCLSVLFPAFAMSSSRHRVALEDAFKPTCSVLLSAPKSSPLSTVSAVQVAQFILHLTNPALVAKKKKSETVEMNKSDVDGRSANMTHERLAEIVLNEIVDALHGDDADVFRMYGKVLANFRFSWTEENDDILTLLRKLARLALSECEDRRLGTVLTKFIGRLDVLLENSDAMRTAGEEKDEGEESGVEEEHTEKEASGSEQEETDPEEAGNGGAALREEEEEISGEESNASEADERVGREAGDDQVKEMKVKEVQSRTRSRSRRQQQSKDDGKEPNQSEESTFSTTDEDEAYATADDGENSDIEIENRNVGNRTTVKVEASQQEDTTKSKYPRRVRKQVGAVIELD